MLARLLLCRTFLNHMAVTQKPSTLTYDNSQSYLKAFLMY